MFNYVIRRLLLILPTVWAIITINFFIIQILGRPCGSDDCRDARHQSQHDHGTHFRRRTPGGRARRQRAAKDQETTYRGARGLEPK